MLSNPRFHRYIKLKGVRGCSFLTYMTSELVGISNSFNNLILTNTVGDTLHHRYYLCIEYVSRVNLLTYIEIIASLNCQRI